MVETRILVVKSKTNHFIELKTTAEAKQSVAVTKTQTNFFEAKWKKVTKRKSSHGGKENNRKLKLYCRKSFRKNREHVLSVIHLWHHATLKLQHNAKLQHDVNCALKWQKWIFQRETWRSSYLDCSENVQNYKVRTDIPIRPKHVWKLSTKTKLWQNFTGETDATLKRLTRRHDQEQHSPLLEEAITFTFAMSWMSQALENEIPQFKMLGRYS